MKALLLLFVCGAMVVEPLAQSVGLVELTIRAAIETSHKPPPKPPTIVPEPTPEPFRTHSVLEIQPLLPEELQPLPECKDGSCQLPQQQQTQQYRQPTRRRWIRRR